MILHAYIDDQHHPIRLEPELVQQAEEFFLKMDSDMDQGWQMSRQWVEQPDTRQRCQIVADRLLSALETHNDNMITLMAGYILSRLPGVMALRIDTNGEIQNTEFTMGPEQHG